MSLATTIGMQIFQILVPMTLATSRRTSAMPRTPKSLAPCVPIILLHMIMMSRNWVVHRSAIARMGAVTRVNCIRGIGQGMRTERGRMGKTLEMTNAISIAITHQ